VLSVFGIVSCTMANPRGVRQINDGDDSFLLLCACSLLRLGLLSSSF